VDAARRDLGGGARLERDARADKPVSHRHERSPVGPGLADLKTQQIRGEGAPCAEVADLEAQVPKPCGRAPGLVPYYLTATGLTMACTAPVMRAGPSVNRNSQAWSLTSSAVSMFSRI